MKIRFDFLFLLLQQEVGKAAERITKNKQKFPVFHLDVIAMKCFRYFFVGFEEVI